jgi:hypothetical protein
MTSTLFIKLEKLANTGHCIFFFFLRIENVISTDLRSRFVSSDLSNNFLTDFVMKSEVDFGLIKPGLGVTYLLQKLQMET